MNLDTNKGRWGVFTHDLYHCSADERDAALIAVFDSYREALACALQHPDSAIHII